MTAVPSFLMDVDEEEADELAEIAGLTPESIRAMGTVELDVIASDYLRKAGLARKDAKGLAESRDAEIMHVMMRYNSRIDGLEQRAEQFEAVVVDIASSLDWSNTKKKSRTVGFGKYGARRQAEKVEIVDPEAALAFAKENSLPLAIKTKETVIHAVIAPFVLDLLRATGEAPAGFEHHAEKETFYCKAEV